MKQKLTDLLYHLNELTKDERNTLRKHFLTYSRDCAGCLDCQMNLDILEVYELHLHHKNNHRKGMIYQLAEQFVEKTYGDPIDTEQMSRDN